MKIMACVQAKAVRVSAGSNLGQLSVLSMRVDMLAADLAVTAGTASQVRLTRRPSGNSNEHACTDAVVIARLYALITVFASH